VGAYRSTYTNTKETGPRGPKSKKRKISQGTITKTAKTKKGRVGHRAAGGRDWENPSGRKPIDREEGGLEKVKGGKRGLGLTTNQGSAGQGY